MGGRSWIQAAFLLILQYAACDDTCTPNPGKVEPTALRLKKKLLCGYDRRVRPRNLNDGSTLVEIELIVQYLRYEPWYNSLDIEAWLLLSWTDDQLTWDWEAFDKMTYYWLDTSYVWVPDIGIRSSITRRGSVSLEGTRCQLYYSGHLSCLPQTLLNAHCNMDLQHWPFDQHTCSFDLGSWTHTGYEMNITYMFEGVSTDWIEREGEWHVEKTKSYNIHEHSESLGLSHSAVRMEFTIKRNAGSLVAIVVVPVFALAAMTYAALLLPPDFEERLVLLSISLLCYFMFLKYLTWIIPPNGANAPLIVLLYRNSTIVTGVAIVLTVLARMLMSSERVAPPWLTEIILKLRSTPGVSILLPPETQKRMLELETIMSCNVPQTEVQTEAEETPVENGDARPPSGGGSEWRDAAVLLDRLTSIVVAVVFTYLLLLGPTM